MPIKSWKGVSPQVESAAFVAEDAWVIGDVSLAEDVSIFFGAVLRGDILAIKVGARSNIQEHSLLHTSYNRQEVLIGESVTVGHGAIIHGAVVEDLCLVGMRATILDDARVGEGSLIAAGSVVTERMKIPPRSMVMGIPAKVTRTLDDGEVEQIRLSALRYVQTGRQYTES